MCQGGSLQIPRPLSWTSTPGPHRPGLTRDLGGSTSDNVPSVIVEVVVVVVVLVFVVSLWCNLQRSMCYFFVDPTHSFKK